MLFKPDLIDKIVSGEKTQTRRIVKPGEYATDYHDGTILTGGGRLKWRSHDDYAVQDGWGRPGVWWNPDRADWLPAPTARHYAFMEAMVVQRTGERFAPREYVPLRLRVVGIEGEYLHAITLAGATKEGFTSIDGFVSYWDKINNQKGNRWADNPKVWVLHFEVVVISGYPSELYHNALRCLLGGHHEPV